MNMKRLGGEIARLRWSQQMTMRELGLLAGVSHDSLAKLESGQEDVPVTELIDV